MPDTPWFTIVPGIRRRTLAASDRMLQIFVTLEADSHLPMHQHPEEQISHVLRGRLRFTIAGEVLEIGAGESVAIGGNVLHTADVLEDALVIDTFSPPRADMLAQDRAASEHTNRS